MHQTAMKTKDRHSAVAARMQNKVVVKQARNQLGAPGVAKSFLGGACYGSLVCCPFLEQSS